MATAKKVVTKTVSKGVMAGKPKPPAVKKAEELKVSWSHDGGWGSSHSEIRAKYGNNFFSANVSGTTNCCGLTEVSGWEMKFQNQEYCDKIMEGVVNKLREDSEPEEENATGYFIMVPVLDTSENFGSMNRNENTKYQKMVAEALSKLEGVVYSPPRINNNTGNLIQVFLVEAA